MATKFNKFDTILNAQVQYKLSHILHKFLWINPAKWFKQYTHILPVTLARPITHNMKQQMP